MSILETDLWEKSIDLVGMAIDDLRRAHGVVVDGVNPVAGATFAGNGEASLGLQTSDLAGGATVTSSVVSDENSGTNSVGARKAS
ncbi:unnamed protein product [Linum trigynum]|uniref:Uncharacterized protein n=1 Tax=Linum trigynum TaxID=586398 RepID=A0AAV2DVP8_9ROSI